MLTTQSIRRVLVLMPIAVLLVAIVPAFAAKKNADYWVGTWATALVIRPAGPPGGPPAAGGPPPAAPNGPPPAGAAAAATGGPPAQGAAPRPPPPPATV